MCCRLIRSGSYACGRAGGRIGNLVLLWSCTTHRKS